MYKLLIVDDEYLSRFVIKSVIQKRLVCLETVGEAENGRQAIEMNRRLRPDIIIMDIKMPGINGIDAAKDILDEFPDVSVLILTAYDNFEYIKTALDIGVKGYILKPVKEDEVVQKVEKVIREREAAVNSLGLNEQAEGRIKMVRPLIEGELVSALISGSYNTEKIEGYTGFLQIDINAGYFMIISPGQGCSAEKTGNTSGRAALEKVYNTAAKHLPKLKKCYFGNSTGDSVIAFFPLKSPEPAADISKEAVSAGREIKNRIKVINGIDVAVGIGMPYSGIQNLNKSYNEANLAIKKAIGGMNVVHYGNIGEYGAESQRTRYSMEQESKLVDQIKIGNMENARELADGIIDSIVNSNCGTDNIKEFLIEFFIVLKRTAEKLGINPAVCGYPEIIMDLYSINDTNGIIGWSRRNSSNILKTIENRSGKSREVISTAFDYINRHFMKDITLEGVADEVGISPQYLSKIFKDKYGSNFIDYITRKRMDYAQELLGSKELDIREVGKAVGYGDPYYFCKIFKKDTGMTPKQYRAQKTAGDA